MCNQGQLKDQNIHLAIGKKSEREKKECEVAISRLRNSSDVFQQSKASRPSNNGIKSLTYVTVKRYARCKEFC
jgi:hypothetical protein